MDNPTSVRTRLSRAEPVPLLVGILLALPTLIAFYPPMTDLPLHEGVVGVLRNFHDERLFPAGLYRLNPWHPNQLFHAMSWLLSLGLGTRWAVKCVIAISQVLILVSAGRLAKHLGRPAWTAVLVAPLSIGFTYYWGLVANLLGFAALFYAMPLIDKANEAPSLRRAAKVIAALTVCFFAHESVFLMGVAFVGILALLKPLSVRDTSLRLLSAVVSFGGALVHLALERRDFTGGQIEAPPRWFPFTMKVSLVPNVLFGSHEPFARGLATALAAVALFALVAARFSRRDPDAPPASTSPEERPRGIRERILAFRLETLGLICTIAYFVVPFNWRGATLLHERFLPVAWAFFVLAAGPANGRSSRLAKLVAGVVPLSVLLLAWPQFVDSSRVYRELEPILERIPKGSAVTLCVLNREGDDSVRVYSPGVGSTRALAVSGGRVNQTLVISSIAPVQINREWRWDEIERRTMGEGSRQLQPSHDLRVYEWVIGRSVDLQVRRSVILAMSPDADLVMQSGDWLLFHSKYPRVPLLTPALAPDRDAETLVGRVYAIEQAFANQAGAP